MDVPQDLHRLRQVVADGPQGAQAGLAGGGAGGPELCLVEVGLQSGLKDIEGGGQDRGCHASYPKWGEINVTR